MSVPHTMEYFKDFPTTSLLIGDLAYFTSENDLIQLFSSVGQVIAAFVCKGKKNNPLYYGFVRMESPDLVAAAIQRYNNVMFMGRPIRVERFSERPGPRSSRFGQLHVAFSCTGLSGRITEETLRTYFENIGQIVDIVISKHNFNKAGSAYGFGFITFENDYHAENAVALMNRVVDNIGFECKISSPRNEHGSPRNERGSPRSHISRSSSNGTPPGHYAAISPRRGNNSPPYQYMSNNAAPTHVYMLNPNGGQFLPQYPQHNDIFAMNQIQMYPGPQNVFLAPIAQPAPLLTMNNRPPQHFRDRMAMLDTQMGPYATGYNNQNMNVVYHAAPMPMHHSVYQPHPVMSSGSPPPN